MDTNPNAVDNYRISHSVPPDWRPLSRTLLGSAGDSNAGRLGGTNDMMRRLFNRLAETEVGSDEYLHVRNLLIELNLPIVEQVARRFYGHDQDMRDIIQAGSVGLIKAVDRYDPLREAEFRSLAFPYVLGEIRRSFRDTSWRVQVPRRLRELRGALTHATDELTSQLNRAPTTAELIDRLKVTSEELLEVRRATNAYHTVPLDRLTSVDEVGLLEPSCDSDSQFNVIELAHILKPILSRFDKREQAVLWMRFGLEMTQSQIGNKLSISQSHVSRILRRCLKRLRIELPEEECLAGD
ncbi:sigma-70 family RNA polymerase sigma factor [Streptomyces sp. WZ-12]|uniref:sigma-70 family RNA polymerase sigma factor n=1 Tax=Streptomyces sp. WZ-12 TaxID=3030210 RepID=UPI002380F53A|nr:sigma-70 family RNA polymerase sigma factor [Streptomyces sp. WZ-12]